MPTLGSLWYTFGIDSKQLDADLKAVEAKLKNLGIELDTKKLTESLKKSVEAYKGKDLALGVKTQYLHDAIRAALKQPEFPIKVTVNKAEAQDAVREALRRAGLQQGFTASDKRQYDAETKRLAAMQVAQARAAASNALAQQRLARAHNIAESATKNHTKATFSLDAALRHNVNVTRDLGNAIGAAFSIVALKNFMTKVVEIGGELEQQKLAMKAILGDEGMANTISSQINTLAVKSPFGIMELNQYAKQLTAFQIPYNELYDTMKRMADVSAAVGVDMGRIILAYGQVRAAKFLKGTELRQFTEANIPLIDMLAERFTKLKGEIVSAGDIIDMVSNKEISFEDVKAVLWELTGEGGRFYNMQEVLSESTKAKWKNLADAIDLMFADIADSTSGPLKGLAELLTTLTENWEKVATVVMMAVVAYGAHKTAMLITNKVLAYNTTLTNLNTRAVGANLTRWKLFQRDIGKGWNRLGKNIKAFFSDIRNLVGLSVGAASAALTGLILLWENNYEEMQEAKRLGEDLFTKATEGARNLGEALRNLQGDFTKLDEVALQSSVSKMEQLIKDYSPEADKVLFESYADENGMRRTSQQRATYLRDYVEEMQSAYDMMKNLDLGGKLFDAIDAEDGHWYTGSWFNDNLKTDIADFSRHWRNFDKEITDFATKYPNDVEKIVKSAQNQSDEFKNATDGMKTYSEMLRLLLEDKRFDNLVEYLDPKSYISNKAQYGWDDIFTEKGDMERAAKEVESEMQGVIKRIKNSLDWDFTDLQDEQKMSLSLMGNKLFEEIDNLAPEAQRRVKQLWEDAFGIKFDESRTRGLILEAFQKELAETEPELAKQIKNGEKLDEAALGKVDEIFVKVKKRLIAKFGPLRGIIEELIGGTDENGETKVNADFRVNVVAQLDETKDLADWQKALVQKIGEDTLQELNITVKGQSDIDSFIDSARKGYKAANEAIKELKPILIKAGINFVDGQEITAVPLSLKGNEVALQAIDEYNKKVQATKAIKEALKAQGVDLDIDPNKNQRAPKDKFAESLKQRFKDIKDAYSMFKEWAKLEGKEAAFKRVGESGLFATLDPNKVPQTVDEYLALIDELEKELKAAGVKGKSQRENLARDLINERFGINKDTFKEQLQLALDKVSKEAERQLANYNLFKKLEKETGNRQFAMNFAFGIGMSGQTDYESLIKEKFNAIAKVYKSTLTFDTATPDLLAKAPEEVRKAWEEAYSEIQKYRNKEREEIADMVAQYRTTQEDIIALTAEAEEKKRKVRESKNLTPVEKQQITAKIDADLNYEVFRRSGEYLKFFNAILSMTGREAEKVGQKIKDALDDKLKAGQISAKDYCDEMEKIDKQLEKIRQKQKGFGGLGSFAKGGLQQMFKDRFEQAQSDYNAATTNQKEATDKRLEAEKQIAQFIQQGDISSALQTEGARMQAQFAEKTAASQAEGAASAMQGAQSAMSIVAMIDTIVHGINDTVQGIKGSFDLIADMADSFGVDTSADTGWGAAGAFFDAFSEASQHATNAWDSLKSGNVGGVIQGVVGSVTSWFTTFNRWHDAKLQKQIERSQEVVQNLQYAYDAIERRMESYLGNARTMRVDRAEEDIKRLEALNALASKNRLFVKMPQKERDKLSQRESAYKEGGAYGYQRQLMTEQLAELEKQRQAELDKKKTDNSAVADYENQIDEMKVQIQQFAEETANALYGIDLNGWAEQLGDSLVDAFAAGEDAAEAFDKTVGDIMRDVTSKMISQDILAPMFGDLRNFLFGENGMGGAFGADFKLDASEMASMKEYLDKIKNEGIPAAEELFNAINEATGGILNETDTAKSGLSAGIQSVTEDTADLLASYINQMRADVAMQTGSYWTRLLDDSLPQMNVIAQSQLDTQRQIAENTLRNAVAAEAIMKSNDDISRLLIRVSQGGAKFYIQ